MGVLGPLPYPAGGVQAPGGGGYGDGSLGGATGAGRERQLGPHLVLALHDQQVGEVERRGVDPDQHLVALRNRLLNILEMQNLGWPVPVVDHGSRSPFFDSRSSRRLPRSSPTSAKR